jgi:hypothetical protein
MEISRPIEWKAAALELANKSSPFSMWRAEPQYDHDGQLFSFATIRWQFEEMVGRARAKIMSVPFLWATTARWPRLRNGDAFFLREALFSARVRFESKLSRGCRVAGFAAPPWSDDEARWLEAETVVAWYARGDRDWVESHSRACFQFQEDFHASMFPRE